MRTLDSTHTPLLAAEAGYRLNPSEYFNGDLKREIQRGIPPTDITDLKRTVLGHSRRIQKSPARVRGYFRNRHIRYAA